MKRIVIVEDNLIVQGGFSMLVGSVENYQVVNTYTNCEDAIKNLKTDSPHVILMDIELPGMNGIEGITRIKKLKSDVMILVISVHENSDLVFDALCAGAMGYLTKSSSFVKILSAIEDVLEGGAPMSSHIAKMVVSSFQKSQNSPLSGRETEVLTLLAKGKSYSVVADELFVHKETIKSHIKNIYHKLHVNSKADAIEIARSNKYI